MKALKKINNARHKWQNFSPRGDRCPLCGKDFRKGCNHSVTQAKDRLFENYIKTIKEKE